jgi:hypothetical protein
MVARLIAILLLIAPLGGCWSIAIGLPCTVGPIIGDKGASTRWTRGEKEQIVALNETGERLCDWRAP